MFKCDRFREEGGTGPGFTSISPARSKRREKRMENFVGRGLRGDREEM